MEKPKDLHVWAIVSGDELTPARFWNRTFFTESEYQNLDEQTQSQCRKIRASDVRFLMNEQKAFIGVGD